MAFTPAHLLQARGTGTAELLKPAELIRMRQLYTDKRYKQCISVCDERLVLELHPVHRAFLLFQQAVSWEALGLAAHNYSRNKIPYYESANEKFTEALNVLPLPFTADEHGCYETPTESPRATASMESGSDSCSRASLEGTPTPVVHEPPQADSESDSDSEYCSGSPSACSVAYSAPDFDKYSPRPELLAAPRSIPQTITFPDIDRQAQSDESHSEEDVTGPDDTLAVQDSKLLSRLSASLSSTHVIADDLVPSPLFKRRQKTATVLFPAIKVPVDDPTVSAIHLPSAPYANGTDHTLVSVRKTAIQTLISRLEGTLPTPSILSPHTPLSLYTDDSLPPSTRGTSALTTPMTPRLDLIHSTFSPDPINYHLETYLTSRSLARYNTALACFRTTCVSAITFTTDAIDRARVVQELHAEEKRRTFLASSRDAGKRMASYWLLSTPAPQSTRPSMHAEDLHDAGSHRTRKGAGIEHEATRKRKERIEKLRAEGWNVRKEKWGWKGMKYYEELRNSAEQDLKV